MIDCLTKTVRLLDQNKPAVLISVIATRGSAPRNAGTRMLVTTESIYGTIGGGHLEFQVIKLARAHLLNTRPESKSGPGAEPDSDSYLSSSTNSNSHPHSPPVWRKRFPLGAALGQCCGGTVELLFERISEQRHQWVRQLQALYRTEQAAVLVTQFSDDESLAQSKASTTEKGSQSDTNLAIAPPVLMRHVVSNRELFGQIEHISESSVHFARALLCAEAGEKPTIEESTKILYEPLIPNEFSLWIFGAGHVGKALVEVLSALPCTIHWIDSRDDQFPSAIPDNVHPIVTDEPAAELHAISPGSFVLIMTHSHRIDETICEQALNLGILSYCGLIGSATKRQRFINRFKARGMSDERIAGLTCPIGLRGITGKHPGEIAIAVSAQLLSIRERNLA